MARPHVGHGGRAPDVHPAGVGVDLHLGGAHAHLPEHRALGGGARPPLRRRRRRGRSARRAGRSPERKKAGMAGQRSIYPPSPRWPRASAGTSWAARITARPARVVERLAPGGAVVRRVAGVGPAHRDALGMGMPSSSAAIWAKTVRAPWPTSVVPTRTTTSPSASMRTTAVETGWAAGSQQADRDPATDPGAGAAHPAHRLPPPARRRRRGRRLGACTPARSSSPGRRAAGSARRTSSGSRPARRARSSICRSPIHCRCVAPKAR